MSKTVVHVKTLEQWKSVLDVWYKQGHCWLFTNTKYQESIFEDGGRFLYLDDYITWSASNPSSKPYIEYSEFMAQQKEDNKMTTVYEVSQLVFDELQRIKAHEGTSLIGAIVAHAPFIKFIEVGNKAILRYIADDPAIEFKVKEQLYRLWRIDDCDDRTYMRINGFGTPDWTPNKDVAFTAPLEEIEKWQTPAWEIEKVQHGK